MLPGAIFRAIFSAFSKVIFAWLAYFSPLYAQTTPVRLNIITAIKPTLAALRVILFDFCIVNNLIK
jgi:hypothetical protein